MSMRSEMPQTTISDKSRRIARNTGLLYVRMLLLIVIGFFTSRVLLDSLGVENYGTYNAVYAVVMLFTTVSAGVANSISRYMAYELSADDPARVRTVFSSAIIIQILMSALLVLLAETVGVWYVKERLAIPPGRIDAAMWVFQMSVVMLIIQMFSTVYNAVIIAHEDMSAFAYISILEGALKLGLAFLIYVSPVDKLITYAVLMAVVALVVRGCYAVFCHRHYEESNGALVWNAAVIARMLSFSGWSFMGNAVGSLNIHGIALLSNSFFGVGVNAARGIAVQVENMTKQFVSNFMTALNPQIIKSYASSDHEYCYITVSKGCKFAYLIMLMFVMPFGFESEAILDIWLKEVPEYAASFTRLTLLCVMLEMMANPLLQLILATGRISAYYIVTSVLGLGVFLFSWLAFAGGMSPEWSYYIYGAVCILTSAVKLFFAFRLADFPVGRFIADVVVKILLVTVLSFAVTLAVKLLLPAGLWASLAVCFVAVLSVCLLSYAVAATPGERSFVKDVLRRFTAR